MDLSNRYAVCGRSNEEICNGMSPNHVLCLEKSKNWTQTQNSSLPLKSPNFIPHLIEYFPLFEVKETLFSTLNIDKTAQHY